MWKLFRKKPRADRVDAKYCVCRTMGETQLEAEVNSKLAQGWQLSGGIAVDGHFYVQALKK